MNLKRGLHDYEPTLEMLAASNPTLVPVLYYANRRTQLRLRTAAAFGQRRGAEPAAEPAAEQKRAPPPVEQLRDDGDDEGSGTVVCVGDTHGHLDKLNLLWQRLGRSLGDAHLAAATVVFLGDYVDRGPDSKGTIERLIQLRDTRPAGKTVFLAGNHDFAFGAYLGCIEMPTLPDLDSSCNPKYTRGFWKHPVPGGMHCKKHTPAKPCS